MSRHNRDRKNPRREGGPETISEAIQYIVDSVRKARADIRTNASKEELERIVKDEYPRKIELANKLTLLLSGNPRPDMHLVLEGVYLLAVMDPLMAAQVVWNARPDLAKALCDLD